jgi:hypothetical protein
VQTGATRPFFPLFTNYVEGIFSEITSVQVVLQPSVRYPGTPIQFER